jgi:hypothetical protein
MADERKTTNDWPAVWHVCAARGTGAPLRFRGACRDGVTVDCAACGQGWVYRKPKPGRVIHGQVVGPRDHF